MAQTFFPITPTEITPANPNAWEPMDASALIAVGATGVILHVVNTGTVPDFRNIGLRKNGSTDDRHPDMTFVCHFWAMIGVDGNRIFEAYVESTTDVDIYVVGYTMTGVAFATNADDMSLGVTGSWQPIDCSAETDPSAIGLIFEMISTAAYNTGLRKNGSSDDRHADVYNHNGFGAVIGCDTSQICEGYIENIGSDFFLVGYITDGATFNLNATDVSLPGLVPWTDLAALPDVSPAPNMGFIEVNSTGTRNYGLRKNGSGEDLFYYAAEHCWGIVECDENRLIEGKVEEEFEGTDFFFVGYSTEAPAPAGIADKSANMGAKMIAGKLI